MEAVTEAWTQLNEASAEKGKKLKEANDLQVGNPIHMCMVSCVFTLMHWFLARCT